MFSSKAILSLIVTSLVIVDASPPRRRASTLQTLNFATQINMDDSLNFIEKDLARAFAFKNGSHHRHSKSASAANTGMQYNAQVGVGSPPTYYTLLVDTGSSNTWVGAETPYTPTTTSHDTGNTISADYGSGNFTGEEWTDTVTLCPGLVIENQSIGVAKSSYGITSFDGILGVGPADLTSRTVSNTNTVPTVMDNLFSQGTISQEVLGVYFVPLSEPISNGSLTFGGINDFVTTSEVAYVPVTTASLASEYWGIDQSISYGGTTILSSTSGLVDTGTTLILIAPDAFQKYQSATGATLDSVTELLTITSSQYANLQPLTFHIGGVAYDLCANGQIWPRSLNTVIGGSSTAIYLVIQSTGSDMSTHGIDFVMGYTFLERYYSVFDTTNHRVGFASTYYTSSTSN